MTASVRLPTLAVKGLIVRYLRVFSTGALVHQNLANSPWVGYREIRYKRQLFSKKYLISVASFIDF